MSSAEQARWFSEHVQPHEPALRAYLSRRFPTLPDHDDLVQESQRREALTEALRSLPERCREFMLPVTSTAAPARKSPSA